MVKNGTATDYVYNNNNQLTSETTAGATTTYAYDGLGSVKQLTDSSEAVTASYTYDAFGNKIAGSGASANVYGFTGEQQFNEADNLIFLRARYYQPSFGRFISRDPIGYAGGINLYAYVKNNPITHVDPSGLMAIIPPGGFGGCGALLTGIIKLFYYNYMGDVRGVAKGKDKFAHCYISCRLTQECGRWRSVAFGYIKEAKDAISPDDKWDWDDIVANNMGNAIGSSTGSSSCTSGGKDKKNKKKKCEDGCSKAFGSGGDMFLP